MTYTIQINEKQRAFIEEALRRTPKIEEDEVLLWEMFKGLPTQEAETPSALHGFSL